MSANCQRIAVIDIGSNTIKLLVADFSGGILQRTVHFESDETRIGGFLGLGENIMPEDAIEAGSRCVYKLQQSALSYSPDQIAVVATSAVREAENRQDFCQHVQDLSGLEVVLLSGQAEAEAISHGVRCDPELKNLEEFYLLDQGGGSLELIHWTTASTQLTSLPLGAVRLYKQFQRSDTEILMKSDRETIAHWVETQWNGIPWLDVPSPAPWIGTGGALTLIRSLFASRRQQTFESSANLLKESELLEFYDEIANISIKERIELGIPASRADILPAGLAAILQLMYLASTQSIRHSVFNLRYGYAASLAADMK